MFQKLKTLVVVVVTCLLANTLVACATGMKMTADELQDIGSDEGLVLGSVRMEGGSDFLGRRGWALVAEKQGRWNPTPSGDYSIEFQRDGDEELFLTKMPAGDYHFYRLAAVGFSSGEVELDIPFRVQAGKTVYLGRLSIQFPDGQIVLGTRLDLSVEDDRDEAVRRAESENGMTLSEVVTDLLRLD